MHEVSDMATRIRNALQVNHSEVNIRATKLGKNIATVLRNEGFITDFKENPNGTHFTITLKYIGKKKQPSLRHFNQLVNQVYVFIDLQWKFLIFWEELELLFFQHQMEFLPIKKQKNNELAVKFFVICGNF